MRLDRKKRRQEIFARGPRYRISTRLVSWFRRYVREGRKLNTIFLVSRIFPGKADSLILLGFDYSINPQNLNKIVRAIFEKIEILNFFLCELPLILGLARKRKNTQKIFARGLQISNLNKIGQLV